MNCALAVYYLLSLVGMMHRAHYYFIYFLGSNQNSYNKESGRINPTHVINGRFLILISC